MYWGRQIDKKLSVLTPQRLRNLQVFSYYSFEDAVTNFDEDRIFPWYTLS